MVMARRRGTAARAFRRAGFLPAICVLLAACGDETRLHGYAPSPEQLSEITVGVDTRATVADTVGAPGSAGVLRDSGFYYVAQEIEAYGFREPRVLRRDVVAITFDETGVVRNIERLNLEDGNVVAYTREVTDAPTEGIGFLRQLGSNLGRILPDQPDDL